MKLLIAAEIFPPAIGGPATYAATLARGLPPRGWEVTVLCYANEVAGEYPSKIIAIPKRGSAAARYWRYFWTLWKTAKGFPVIYAQGPVSSGLPALIVAKLRRKKLVVKVTGDYAWEQAFRAGATKSFLEEFQKERALGKFRLLRAIEQFVCRRANLVVAPSEFLKKIVSGWGVPSEKIAMIYNAINFPVQGGERTQLRKDFGIAEGEMLIVSAGRAVPWKGFGVLGRAVAELQESSGRSIRLVCIGITDEELRAMIADAGGSLPISNKRISGIGVVGQDQLVPWLRAADCFVLNTAYEGLSHVILEAMHAGVPIITTDVGGNRELIINRKTGILVPYNDMGSLKTAILEIAENATLSQTLGKELAKKLQPFHRDFMLQALESWLTRTSI